MLPKIDFYYSIGILSEGILNQEARRYLKQRDFAQKGFWAKGLCTQKGLWGKGFCTLQRFWALIIWDCRDIEHASKGFCAKIFWAIPKIRLIFSLILQINPPQVNPPQVNLPQVNPPQVNSPQVNHPKCKPPKCNLPAGQSSCRSIFPQVNPPQIKLPKWNLPKFKTLKCNPPWADFSSYDLKNGVRRTTVQYESNCQISRYCVI